MNTSLRAYLEALRQFPQVIKRSPRQYFRRPGKDFTRTRILHLERIVWLTITLLKSTLRVKLDQFFSWLNTGEVSPTKSALVQARQKTTSMFFKDMFMLRLIPEIKLWLKDFFRQLIQTMEPVRPGKNKVRRRRILRGTERHVHEQNYRPAF